MMIPQLPTEILQHVLEALWQMPLTTQARTTLMTTLPLVNSTWADLFDMISTKNVYIMSPAIEEHFLHSVRASAQPSSKPSRRNRFCRLFRWPGKRMASNPPPKRSANLACQTLTIQIANPAIHPHLRPHMPMTNIFDELLENIDAHSLLPNLHALSIEYVDAPFEDVFLRMGLAALPEHVSDLAVSWSYSDGMPPWLATALREKQKPQRTLRWASQSVQRVSVSGAGENVVKDLRRVCPNAKISVN
ncbi:hypothetical protein MIND_00308900 [Mycena indigotica]|uniref:Uncharacterized protein n=1 Tax=Mycena indigotica TaxID=2126181 RepID=A0A8H6T1M5_9AGAR|nr:uncharacterized protein MIND_00308900 [Mycena indigotica]KAF7309381.1 hypothetical protein MIND_00308900 [Mycena indigotica]